MKLLATVLVIPMLLAAACSLTEKRNPIAKPVSACAEFFASKTETEDRAIDSILEIEAIQDVIDEMDWRGPSSEGFQAISMSLAQLYAGYEGCEQFGRLENGITASRAAFSSGRSKESYRLLMEAHLNLSNLLDEFYGFNEVTYEMGEHPLRRPLRLYGEKDDFGSGSNF
jgi:hypothetical protein